jgi:hypothetical protein
VRLISFAQGCVAKLEGQWWPESVLACQIVKQKSIKGRSLDCVTSERDITETYANICTASVALFNFHYFELGPMPYRITA